MLSKGGFARVVRCSYNILLRGFWTGIDGIGGFSSQTCPHVRTLHNSLLWRGWEPCSTMTTGTSRIALKTPKWWYQEIHHFHCNSGKSSCQHIGSKLFQLASSNSTDGRMVRASPRTKGARSCQWSADKLKLRILSFYPLHLFRTKTFHKRHWGNGQVAPWNDTSTQGPEGPKLPNPSQRHDASRNRCPTWSWTPKYIPTTYRRRPAMSLKHVAPAFTSPRMGSWDDNMIYMSSWRQHHDPKHDQVLGAQDALKGIDQCRKTVDASQGKNRKITFKKIATCLWV